MNANVLRWPPLYKKMSLAITFELRHLRWWFWHLDLCFWGQGIWWSHLFLPMTLTFQGHDLCEITFLPYFSYYWAKCCQILTQDSFGQDLFNKSKSSLSCLSVWHTEICYVGHHYAKDVFGHTFELQNFRWRFCCQDLCFFRSRNPLVPFLLKYDLALSRSWPLQITFWATSHILIGKVLTQDWGQGIHWYQLFRPVTLTFQGHDHCKSHFRPHCIY